MTFETRTIDLGGPVSYADFGGDGPPLVLVHGLGGSHVNWMAVAPALAKHFRVVAPDLAGFGLTPPAGRRSHVADNRALLGRFLEAVVGGPALLMGNSMGGLLSLWHAAEKPEAVKAMVLVDPALPLVNAASVDRKVVLRFAGLIMPFAAEWAMRRAAAERGAEGLVQDLMRLCCADANRVNAELWKLHVEMAQRRLDHMPWANTAMLQGARSLVLQLFRREQVRRWVKAVKAPTLVVQGAQDRLVSVLAARNLKATRPEFGYVELADCGHVPMLENPAAFLEAVLPWLQAQRG